MPNKEGTAGRKVTTFADLGFPPSARGIGDDTYLRVLGYSDENIKALKKSFDDSYEFPGRDLRK